MSQYLDNSLKLILSDSVNMPDDEYVALSGILNTFGLSDVDNSYGILNVFLALAKHSMHSELEFPMSLESLEQCVNHDSDVVDFNRYIIPMVTLGFITLNRDKEYQDVVIVSITDKFDLVLDTFIDVLTTYSINDTSVTEGLKLDSSYPAYVTTFAKRVYGLLEDLDIVTDLESYTLDDKTFNVSFHLSKCSNYQITSNALDKLAKSYLSTGNKAVVNFDCYKDGKYELYVSLDFAQSTRDLSDIAVDIYNLVEDLELNYVK